MTSNSHNPPNVMKVESISLLKQTTSSGTSTNPQLKRQLRKTENAVMHFQESITQRRLEIRKLSDNVSRIVEKKLTRAPKDRPSLYPGSVNNENLAKLYRKRNQLHHEISEIKSKISESRPAEESELIEQTLKKRTELDKAQTAGAVVKHQILYMKKDIDNNRKKLDQFASSQLLKNIEESQKELETTKKHLRQLERQHYSVYNEEVLNNMFFFEMKDYITEKDKPVNPSEDEKRVDQKEIHQEIEEMQIALEERKKLDKEQTHIFALKKKEFEHQIGVNFQLERSIRELMNESMKIGLSAKRYKSERKRRISSEVDTQKGKYSMLIPKKVNQVDWQEADYRNKDKGLSKTQQQIFVTIGNWFKRDINEQGGMVQGSILTDQIAQKKLEISHLDSLNFLLNKSTKSILGIQAVYADSYTHQISGDSLWKSDAATETQLISIKLENVVSLSYCNRSHENGVETSNSNNSISFLQWNFKDEEPTIIGNKSICECVDSSLEKISLEEKSLKNIKVLIFPYSLPSPKGMNQVPQTPCFVEFRLKSLKFTLFPKPVQERIRLDSQNDEEQFLKAPQRSYSVSDLNKPRKPLDGTIIMKKKVVILRGATLKKISEIPQIDHRLLSNRKKLV